MSSQKENNDKKTNKSVPKYNNRYCRGGKIFHDPQLITKRGVNINTSTSKQMYAFGTEKRFAYYKKPLIEAIYSLPSVKDRFYTTFGYGKKFDFTAGRLNGKSQNYYNIPREFELFRKNTPQYSFGKGRDVCKRPEYSYSKGVPGVGSYNLRKEFGADALKFSLFGRGWVKKKKSPSYIITPGPGHYEETLKTNEKGNYADSHFANTWKIKFGGPERFKIRNNGNPGPGEYETGTMFNSTGYHYTSKFHSNMAKSMGNRPDEFYRPYQTSNTPGPGSYNPFSDFSGYANKDKRCRCGRKLGHPPVRDGYKPCTVENISTIHNDSKTSRNKKDVKIKIEE